MSVLSFDEEPVFLPLKAEIDAVAEWMARATDLTMYDYFGIAPEMLNAGPGISGMQARSNR